MPVYAPLDAVVHSFQDNAHFGDYGPTIILEHELDDESFFTLYGHPKGDFPGVGKPSERELWLKLCPNPNLILQINKL